MRRLITGTMLLISFSAFASIEGLWQVLDHQESKVRFIEVDSTYYSHTQEKFVYPDGNLSHTIDQSVKLTVTEGKVRGSVDFFDSRGCSYQGYEVAGKLTSENSLSLLMTVPRYRLVKITTGSIGSSYQRPRYCWRHSPHYPYQSYRYICGYENNTSTRTECRLEGTVQVPVALKKI